jgi:hypothetical protein
MASSTFNQEQGLLSYGRGGGVGRGEPIGVGGGVRRGGGVGLGSGVTLGEALGGGVK